MELYGDFLSPTIGSAEKPSHSASSMAAANEKEASERVMGESFQGKQEIETVSWAGDIAQWHSPAW